MLFRSEKKTIAPEEAAQIVAHLEKQGYISPEGQAQPALQTAIEQNSLNLPQEVAAARVEVAKTITSVTIASEAAATPVTTAALKTALSGATYTQTVRTEKTVSYEDAQELLTHLHAKGYTDKNGKIKDTLKNALKTGTVDLPKKFEAARERVESVIKGEIGRAHV